MSPALNVHTQSPRTDWTSARAATAAVSARRMRGPREIRNTLEFFRICSRSASSKPPSGPISSVADARGAGFAARRRPAQNRDGIGDLGVFVAEDQQPLAQGSQPVRKIARFDDLRHVQQTALFRGLDHIGAQALQIHAPNLSAPREHGNEPRDAHLRGFLNHVIEARLLERREGVVEIAGRALRARLFEGDKRRLLARSHFDPRPPFAVAAVEQQHRIVRAQAQHVQEVVPRRRSRNDARADMKRRFDE